MAGSLGQNSSVSLLHVSVFKELASIWHGCPDAESKILHRFLQYFDSVLSSSLTPFCFQNGSLGNFVLSGARCFFSSLEAAIGIFRHLTSIPDSVQILPIIESQQRHRLAARLVSGELIHGQSEISHPDPTNLPPSSHEPAHIFVKKETLAQLPSRIDRVFYEDANGQAWCPDANPSVLNALQTSKTVVLAMGSLYTSIIPCLIAGNVGRAFIDGTLKTRILIINTYPDRETHGMSAVDFVHAITDALNQSSADASKPGSRNHPPSTYLTHVIYSTRSEIPVNVKALRQLGLTPVAVEQTSLQACRYEPNELFKALSSIIHA